MAGYQTLKILLKEEIDAYFEEGRIKEKESYLKKLEEIGENRQKLTEFYGELEKTEVLPDFPYTEPSEYDEIMKECSDKYTIPDISENPYDYFHGAWLGRCIGCALGQPVEGWSAEGIKDWFEKAGRKAVDGYVPTHSGERVNNGQATSENIKCMPVDDDTRFTVMALKLLKSKGFDFDTYDVGASWMYTLPYRYICTAENQAYLNFANVDEFGPWGKVDNAMEILKKSKISTYLNPYREWIGAQIRIDGYAYAAAGNPKKAAELAYRDAFLSHTKNGIYGAMFFAALISAAFAEKSTDKCIDIALSQIPTRSRLYAELCKIRKVAEGINDGDELVEKVLASLTPYNWVHTINNASICLASIIYGKGDFAKAVTTAVKFGFDTDCNGATVGSFMGALTGESKIPDFLKNPLNDTFYSGLSPYDPGKISDVAREFEEIYKKNK